MFNNRVIEASRQKVNIEIRYDQQNMDTGSSKALIDIQTK